MHSVLDLSTRAVSAEQGGLCGLAAMYQALDDTIMTKSQLRDVGYDDMKYSVVQEMLMTASEARRLSDADLLMHFHTCEYRDKIRVISFTSSRDLHRQPMEEGFLSRCYRRTFQGCPSYKTVQSF